MSACCIPRYLYWYFRHAGLSGVAASCGLVRKAGGKRSRLQQAVLLLFDVFLLCCLGFRGSGLSVRRAHVGRHDEELGRLVGLHLCAQASGLRDAPGVGLAPTGSRLGVRCCAGLALARLPSLKGRMTCSRSDTGAHSVASLALVGT